MTDPKDLLGKSESEKLEFKGRDALDQPEKIGREVVAFLNAKGGVVWVGIAESEGRAVQIEDIANATEAARRLKDHLIATIEPPITDEVDVEAIGDPGVLRVGITHSRSKRTPYAQLLKGSSRIFVVRVGDRIRPMGREEIFAPASSAGKADELQKAEKRLR